MVPHLHATPTSSHYALAPMPLKTSLRQLKCAAPPPCITTAMSELLTLTSPTPTRSSSCLPLEWRPSSCSFRHRVLTMILVLTWMAHCSAVTVERGGARAGGVAVADHLSDFRQNKLHDSFNPLNGASTAESQGNFAASFDDGTGRWLGRSVSGNATTTGRSIRSPDALPARADSSDYRTRPRHGPVSINALTITKTSPRNRNRKLVGNRKKKKIKGKRRKPTSKTNRKSPTMTTKRNSGRKLVVPPKFMLDLYYMYRAAGEQRDTRERPTAGVVRGFTHTNKGSILRETDTSATVRRLRFDLSSLLAVEKVTSAELRLHLNPGRTRRTGREGVNPVRVCVLLVTGAAIAGDAEEGGERRGALDCHLYSRGGGKGERRGRGWGIYNVTEAVRYWRMRGGEGVEFSHRQELDVRLEYVQSAKALEELPNAEVISPPHLKDSPNLKDPSENPDLRPEPAPSLTPCPPRLDVTMSRPKLRPLLVVYSEEPQPPPVPSPTPEEEADDGELPKAAVTEKSNSVRLTTKHKGRHARGATTGGVVMKVPPGGGAREARNAGRDQEGGDGDGDRRRKRHSRGSGHYTTGSEEINDVTKAPLHAVTPVGVLTSINIKVNPNVTREHSVLGLIGPGRILKSHRRGIKRAAAQTRRDRMVLLPGGGMGKSSGNQRRLKRGKSRRRSRRACRRVPMFVNFADINWHKWVIAPKGYEAYQCSGRCDFPLSDRWTPTKHAIVQALMHINAPDRAARACCVATRLESISILYVDEHHVVTFKYRYQGMMVSECGCR